MEKMMVCNACGVKIEIQDFDLSDPNLHDKNIKRVNKEDNLEINLCENCAVID